MLNLVGRICFYIHFMSSGAITMDATSTIRGIAKQDVCLEGLLLLY